MTLMSPVGVGSSTLDVVMRGMPSVSDLCLLTLLAACTLGLMTHLDGETWIKRAWGIATGIALAAVYITREEGLWVSPLMLMAVAYIAFVLLRQSRAHGIWRLLAYLSWPAGTTTVILLTICSLNFAKYRVWGVVEIKQPSFTAAMGALQRVEPEPWRGYIAGNA